MPTIRMSEGKKIEESIRRRRKSEILADNLKALNHHPAIRMKLGGGSQSLFQYCELKIDKRYVDIELRD